MMREHAFRRRGAVIRAAAACVALTLAAGLVAASAGAAALAEHGRRSRVAGLDLVTYRTQVKDVVVILGSLPAGDAMAGSGNIAIPTLTGMMLDRGTEALDKFQIADRLDGVGAQISFVVGTETVEIRAKCLKKDLGLVLGLIAAELRTPALSGAEFAKAKLEFAGALQSSLQNPAARAREAFARAIYPPHHPNRPATTEEYLAAASSAGLDEVRRFHARYYGPRGMVLVVAGDVEDAVARREVGRHFAGWRGGEEYVLPAAATAPRLSAERLVVPLKDKPSTSMMLGQATGLRYRDPDALALRIGTTVLGHGFTGRLMGTVRDREGLTYGIGAGMGGDSIVDGDWFIAASFAPSLLERGLASTRRVLAGWWAGGVTEAELAAHKQGLLGNYRVGLATTGGAAAMILASIQRGYDLDWLDRYPQAIESLTREEVNRAIKTHLDPDTMVLVEAGSVPAVDAAPPPPPPPGSAGAP